MQKYKICLIWLLMRWELGGDDHIYDGGRGDRGEGRGARGQTRGVRRGVQIVIKRAKPWRKSVLRARLP